MVGTTRTPLNVPVGGGGGGGGGVLALGARRFEFVAGSPDVAYCGTAELGTAEGTAAWFITKLTFTAAGAVSATATASDVTWTGRAGHTYA